MNNEEGIFNARYEKVLELVEKVGPDLVKRINKFVSQFPNTLKRHISNEKSCELNSTETAIDLEMHDNMMEIRHFNFVNCVDSYLYIYPFYISELEEFNNNDKNEGEHDMLLASITHTNTKGKASAQLLYKEENGKYIFQGVKVPNGAKEFDFSAYLDKVKGEYILTYIISFNDIELKEIKQKISYDELVSYSCDAVEDYDELDSDTDY